MAKKKQNKESSTGRSNVADTVVLYCLYALVGLLPLAFAYPTYDIFELTKLTVLRLITLTLVGAWCWKIFRDRTIKIARTPIDWFVLAYLAVFTLATILSKNPRLSLLGDYGRFEGLLTILNYGFLFLLTGSLIRDNSAIHDRRDFLRSLVFTAIAAADIMSVYGICQRFGIDFLVWSSAGTDLSRAFSTLGNPIYIAAYLTIILSLAIAFFVVEKMFWPRMFLGASITAMFATLVFTFSRAGWAGFLFALVVMSGLGMAIMFRTRRSQDKAGGRPKAVLPVVILAVVIIAVAAVSLTVSSRVASAPTKSALERALSSFNLESGGVADRVYLWRSAIAMIKDRPVLGWGPETFGTYFPKYRTAEFAHYELNVLMRPKILFQNRPHSDILQAGTSAGVSGIAAYLALLIAYFWFAIRRLMGIDNLADTALLVGIIGGLAGYFAQIQFSFSTIAVSPIVWLLMALTFVIGENRNDGASLDKIPHPVLIASLVILEIVVLVGIFLSARPLVADYYFDQAVSALEKSDSYTAGLEFDRAMALNPYEPEYPNFAGNMFVEVAKASQDADTATTALTTAIDYLEKGIALNPDMPGYHYNMANVKYYYSMIPGLDKGLAEITMKEALGEYLFAIEADPNNPDVHLNLASAYMRFDRKAQAIAEIRKALKLSPNNVAAKSALMKLEEEK